MAARWICDPKVAVRIRLTLLIQFEGCGARISPDYYDYGVNEYNGGVTSTQWIPTSLRRTAMRHIIGEIRRSRQIDNLVADNPRES